MNSPIDSRLPPAAVRCSHSLGGPKLSDSSLSAARGARFADLLKSAMQHTSRPVNGSAASVERADKTQAKFAAGPSVEPKVGDPLDKVAYTTLLDVHGKLVSAFDEIRNMSI